MWVQSSTVCIVWNLLQEYFAQCVQVHNVSCDLCLLYCVTICYCAVLQCTKTVRKCAKCVFHNFVYNVQIFCAKCARPPARVCKVYFQNIVTMCILNNVQSIFCAKCARETPAPWILITSSGCTESLVAQGGVGHEEGKLQDVIIRWKTSTNPYNNLEKSKYQILIT